jgi:hypothetical protein
MSTNVPAAVLILTAFMSAGPALADDNGTADQQRDCSNDAMIDGNRYIFAPDRDAKIGLCLWHHRTLISQACQAQLRAAREVTTGCRLRRRALTSRPSVSSYLEDHP